MPAEPGLAVYREWTEGAGLLDRLRRLFVYGPGEDRANGYLYSAGEQPWPSELAGAGPDLLMRLEDTLGVGFGIALFQAYMDGSGCDWHDDGTFDAQAILSLGVTRIFGIRPRNGEPTWITLNHGDLVYMPPGFQSVWQHCVPVAEVIGERVSLVFRTAVRS